MDKDRLETPMSVCKCFFLYKDGSNDQPSSVAYHVGDQTRLSNIETETLLKSRLLGT